jgi:hypothetical protein
MIPPFDSVLLYKIVGQAALEKVSLKDGVNSN